MSEYGSNLRLLEYQEGLGRPPSMERPPGAMETPVGELPVVAKSSRLNRRRRHRLCVYGVPVGGSMVTPLLAVPKNHLLNEGTDSVLFGGRDLESARKIDRLLR